MSDERENRMRRLLQRLESFGPSKDADDLRYLLDIADATREHVKQMMRRGDMIRCDTSPRALAFYEAAGHAARTILNQSAEPLRVQMVIEDAEAQFTGGENA